MAIMNEVTEVLHRIKAKLYPNYLGKGEGAYIARSKAEAPLSIEDICASADQLEALVAKNAWPYPGYEDMLFVL
jgi:glutamine synthetase type III